MAFLKNQLGSAVQKVQGIARNLVQHESPPNEVQEVSVSNMQSLLSK